MKMLLVMAAAAGLAGAASFPAPAMDVNPKSKPAPVVLAGGCYWGMQAVFERLKGVTKVTAGYAGAATDPATGKRSKDGGKGHAEAVRIVYDPARISYGALLEVFFAVAHDPTELNRQGPDIGTEYRSAIFYADDEQKKVAEAYIRQLTQAKAFPYAIVTQVTAFEAFYAVDEDQQHWVDRHADSDYVIENDLPRLAALRRAFPDLAKR
jgi:peptide-methionine (S)-S-oxide reductase